VIWGVRIGFALAILALVALAARASVDEAQRQFAALAVSAASARSAVPSAARGEARTSPADAPPGTSALLAPVAQATLPPTPRPTQTPQAIISRMARTTPTPASRPVGQAADQTAISISDAGFWPAELRVQVGRTVTWKNDGQQGHDVSTSGQAGGGWGSGLLAPSGTFGRVFTSPGQYDYLCSVHSVMRGRIVVEP
jgi:plastocyanin